MLAEPQPTICPRCASPNPPQARFCKDCRFRLTIQAPNQRSYRVVRIIKAGGMGAVYEACDEAGQRYAIKELLNRAADSTEQAERVTGFLTEADLLQRIRHPQIPRVFQSWSDPFVDQASGEQRLHYYLVLEFIEGEDLEQLLVREGRQPEARVLRWAASLCDVLSYLHYNDLIYRDLKPSNIMVLPHGDNLKLIDFGIAIQRNTRGALIGTPGYSPPEQYQGVTSQASDIYALGATLHHLLSGRDPRPEPPFTFPPLRQLNPSVSPQVEAAIRHALAMRSAERWASVEAFKAALLGPALTPSHLPRREGEPAEALARPDAQPAQAQAAHPTAPAPPTPEAPQPRLPRMSRFLRWLGRLFVVVLLLASASWAVLQRPELLQITRFLPPTSQAAPEAALQGRAVSYALELTAPPGSDAAALRAHFELSFDNQVRQEFGPAARRDPAVPLVFDSQPTRLPDGDPLSPRYRATLGGAVLVP
jgi:serine/threonine-protein kinase